jgi:SAM-dependent methyltransferase
VAAALRDAGNAEGAGPAGLLVLDFGCGEGFLLDAVRRLGHRGVGVEICATSARTAREKGHDVRFALDDLAPLAGTLDAAFAIHVLEHVPDVEETLGALAALLAPGGRFHFEVPNAASLQARIFGRRWLHLEADLHVHHFTPESFSALLSRHGFVAARTSRRSLEQGVAGWLQSFYNLFFPYNRFFRAFILNRPWQDKARALPELALLPLVLPLALLGHLVETRLCGNGAVLLVEGRLERAKTGGNA